MKRMTRGVAASAIVLVGALSLGACASTDTPATDAGTTTTTRSAAPTTTATGYTDKAAFLAALQRGAAKSKTAHVEMTMSVAGQKVTMSGDTTAVDPQKPAMQMTMDMSGQKLELILHDGQLYMQGLPGMEPGKWAKMELTGELAKQMEDSLKQADPAKMAQTYEKATTDVKLVGKDTVVGVAVDKYEVVMKTDQLGEAVPSENGTKLPDTITYLMWLDGEDLLRKVTFDVAGAESEILMSKYGEPVDIKVPAAADVIEVPSS